MLHLRHLIRPLVVIALLATTLALAAAAPAGAQSTIRVFTFESDDGADWEVQVTVQALGGCNPPNARPGYVTSWLGPDDEDGEVLDPGVCNYRLTAIARNTATRSQLCDAELKWSTGNYGSSLQTSSSPADDIAVEARHTGENTPSCAAQPTLAITIEPDVGDNAVVQPLPGNSTDSNLTVRARRAVEITEFRVKVTPESTSVGRAGCDQTLDFFVLGDGDAVEKALSSIGSGVTCEFRITVTEAPPPFIIRDSNGKKFSTANKNINTGQIELDLSDQVQLPWNRISIVQDVVNNPGEQGSVSYEIGTECGGVAGLPPIIGVSTGTGIHTLPGGGKVAQLQNTRRTVHRENVANFGPGAVYPAVASSTTSDRISGCSVTATIGGLPEGCTLAGSSTRTLTWSSANPLRYFDFEFDIYCSGSRPPGSPALPPATDDSSGTSTDDTDDVATVGTADVRIVARLLVQREDRVRSAAVAGRRHLG